MTSKSRIFSAGLALFSMFFGAGNIVFPLILGKTTGNMAPYAVFGMCLTAVFIPIMGVVAMLLFEGNTKAFFARMGKIPGMLLIALIMALIGPFGGLPRCVALSFSTLSFALPELSPSIFCALSCLMIFAFCFRKERITTLLGAVLTPLLLLSIAALIALGIKGHAPTIYFRPQDSFFVGLKQGYQTLDLLASFFFSGILLHSLDSKAEGRRSLKPLFFSSLIAAFLLCVIYAGLCLVACRHLVGVDVASDQLLSYLAFRLLGPVAGYISCAAVALACLTTAISLAAIFATYLKEEILGDRISYPLSLIITLLITFFISQLQFRAIVAFIAPILEVCYPALLLLTVLNIAYKMRNFRPVKAPLSIAFAWSVLVYALSR